MSISVGPVGQKLWMGLAADTKPTAADVRLAMNDVFFEKDTFKYYIWDGAAWWPTTSAAGTGGTPPII